MSGPQRRVLASGRLRRRWPVSRATAFDHRRRHARQTRLADAAHRRAALHDRHMHPAASGPDRGSGRRRSSAPGAARLVDDLLSAASTTGPERRALHLTLHDRRIDHAPGSIAIHRSCTRAFAVLERTSRDRRPSPSRTARPSTRPAPGASRPAPGTAPASSRRRDPPPPAAACGGGGCPSGAPSAGRRVLAAGLGDLVEEALVEVVVHSSARRAPERDGHRVGTFTY